MILFKAGKSIQKEVENMRSETNTTINEMIAAVNKLKIEHQTRAFVRNQPAAEQQAKADEARGTVIKKSKDRTKEKTRPIYEYKYTGCPRRNVKYFGRVFLMLNYTYITQNTYIQS